MKTIEHQTRGGRSRAEDRSASASSCLPNSALRGDDQPPCPANSSHVRSETEFGGLAKHLRRNVNEKRTGMSFAEWVEWS